MGGEAWKYYTSANRGRDRKAPVWISCADPDAWKRVSSVMGVEAIASIIQLTTAQPANARAVKQAC
jgi:hypothetical protein